MKSLRKKHLFSIILGFATFVLITTNGFSVMWVNGAGGSGDDGGEKAAEVNPVENLVIQGAIHYLQSCSDIQAINESIFQLFIS